MDDVTIVLQGPANNYTIETALSYLQLDFVSNIIISCWDTDKFEIVHDEPRISIVKNKLNNMYPGTSNINLQIYTSLNGLKNVKSRFAVKMRSDQRYLLSDIQKMYTFYSNNNTRDLSFHTDELKPRNKIGVCGIVDDLPFHPCDHTYWGNIEDLIDFFDIPYNNAPLSVDWRYSLRAEIYLGANYVSKFDKRIEEFIQNPIIYLTDKNIVENDNHKQFALDISKRISDKIFLRFMRLPFEWIKHYNHDTEGHNNAISKTYKSIWYNS
jgi:hypothetical protein